MSYILEALRKAEQERNLGQVPDLETVYSLPNPPRRRLWPWLVTLAVLTNAGVLIAVLMLWQENSRLTQVAVAPAAAPTAEPDSVPAPPVPPSELMARSSQLDLAPVMPTPVPVTIPEPSTAELPEVVSTYDVNWEPPPALRVLPTDVRSALPELNLDIHVYSTDPAKRFVMINSRRYQEGEQLFEGLLLEVITTEGAVLSHHGQRFTLGIHD